MVAWLVAIKEQREGAVMVETVVLVSFAEAEAAVLAVFVVVVAVVAVLKVYPNDVLSYTFFHFSILKSHLE